jgi:hypothetical protein
LFEKIDKFEKLPGGIVPDYNDNWQDFVALRSLYTQNEKSLEEAKNYINKHDKIVQEIVYYLSKSSGLTTKNYLDNGLRDKLRNLTPKQKENKRILLEFVRMVDLINKYISDADYDRKLFNKRYGYGSAIARI